MPDWTYQTVFRPALRLLPYAVSQSLVFGVLGRLGRYAAGRFVVRMMGHAQAPRQVRVSVATPFVPTTNAPSNAPSSARSNTPSDGPSSGLTDEVIGTSRDAANGPEGHWTLTAPCGLGVGVDLSAQAVSALSLFGVGLLEVGPIDLQGAAGSCDPQADAAAPGQGQPAPSQPAQSQQVRGTQWTTDGVAIDRQAAQDLDSLVAQLQRQPFSNGVDVLAVLLVDAATADDQLYHAIRQLQDLVTGFVIVFAGAVDADRLQQLRTAWPHHRLVLAVPETTAANDIDDTIGKLIDGIRLEAADPASATVRVKNFPSTSGLTIVRGGVREPGQGFALLNAGADVVLLDEGLPVAGPGLPKRINGNVVARQNARQKTEHKTARKKERKGQRREKTALPTSSWPDAGGDLPVVRQSWLWCLLLGVALTAGGILALVIGWTRVVLPYDEEFLGMLREEICAINPRLLPFMSHDRVTLAGTMLALGPLYCFLACGDRQGLHWAKVAWVASAFVGFFSFFSFLGFGYFDPFHAFISVVLFQLTLFGWRSDQRSFETVEYDLANSTSWRWAMWGQLLMVLQGLAIFVAGMVISGFGMTSVFVTEDLQFMNTTREALLAANPRLVPLVAHDRASFGGMLLSTGVAVFLSALWGWQRGRRWLWMALACSGTTAYGCTLVIHFAVGYTSSIHLLPAYGGLAVLWLALLLSRRWMFEEATAVVATDQRAHAE